MVYTKIKIIMILSFMIITSSFAEKNFFKAEKEIKLPVLATKQDLHNIRFLSMDGKYTYYQNSSGKLFFSAYYKTHIMNTGKKGSTYLIGATPLRKKITIEHMENLHQTPALTVLNELFVGTFGEAEIHKFGDGVNPKLHLNDSWFSYYDPILKKIYFKSLKNKKDRFSISLRNNMNVFFVPQIIMISDGDILYTDINLKGQMGIIKLNRASKENKTLYKAKIPGRKIELCKVDNHIILGEFGIYDIAGGSSIYRISKISDDLKDKKQIYYSPFNDIGNIECNYQKDEILFVKSVEKYGKMPLFKTEIASLNLKSGKIKILTSLKNVTQVVNMDGRILIPYRNDYYVLKGKFTKVSDQLGKKKIKKKKMK